MWKSKPCLWIWLSRGRACWLAELSCNLWSGMQCVMRCARSRSSAHTVFFLPARLLFPTLLSDIFQILNPRLFSSCLQNRQRLKKEERARSQAKCRRTSCDTCPSSCPPEQLGATIAEMGDHARIDVDSPLWDQTTFIGLPSMSAENDLRRKNSGRFRHFAWMSNPLSGLNSTATLMEAKKLVSAKKRSPTQLLQIFEFVRWTIIEMGASLLGQPGRKLWTPWLCIGVTWRFLTIGIGSLYS